MRMIASPTGASPARNQRAVWQARDLRSLNTLIHFMHRPSPAFTLVGIARFLNNSYHFTYSYIYVLELLTVTVARIPFGNILNFGIFNELHLRTFTSPIREIVSVQGVLNDALSFAIERICSTKIGCLSL